jgi:adenylate kinase
MNIVLLGAPGAGKGTQAEQIIETYGVPHISTGDILRAAVADGTPLGRGQDATWTPASSCPDFVVVIGLVKSRLSEPDTDKGFILDGFPRTTRRLEALDRELDRWARRSRPLSPSLSTRRDRQAPDFTSDMPWIVARITNVLRGLRHEVRVCGGELYQRDDDNEDTVRNRLDVYERSTAPLIEYYGGKGVLHKDRRRPAGRHGVGRCAPILEGCDPVIVRKSAAEIEIMREAGRISARALRLVGEAVAPGVTTGNLDTIAEEAIRPQERCPAFKGYHGFPATLCTSLNSAGGARHPRARVLAGGRHPLGRRRGHL